MRLNDVGIVSVKGFGYRIHFLYMSKDEAINFLRNADLTVKNGFLKNIKIYYHI